MDVIEWLRWPGMRATGVVRAVAYSSETGQETFHRGVPGPYVTLVVTTEGDLGLAGSASEHGSPEPLTRMTSTLAGLHTTAAALHLPRRQRGLQLTLDPLLAWRMFGSPAGALPPFGAPLDAVLGRAGSDLAERIADCTDAAGLASALEGSSLGPALRHEPRRESAEAWHYITSRHGCCRIRDVASHVGYSQRHLRTIMRADLGVSPKTAARVARVAHVVERLARSADETVADTAQRAGYADHSHLDAEFKATMGCSPTQWLAEESRNIQAGGHRYEAE